jgi:dephospho-CoA kinase
VNIALTGGIGSGKSSVATILADALQAAVVSADLICRDLMQPDALGWHDIRLLWGDRFLHPDRTIDRALLGQAVFQDAGMRRQLEAILHPLIRSAIEERMSAADQAGEDLVIEIPLLFEVGWQEGFDCTVAVYAPEEICLQRIQARDGVSQEQAERMLAAQMPPAKKAGMAMHVIDNSGLWVQTVQQVGRLAKSLRKKSRQ